MTGRIGVSKVSIESKYSEFILSKSQWKHDAGIPVGDLPSYLKDFQHALLEWSISKGRAALLTDCGTGKSIMELVFADKISRHENGRFLLATPIAVGEQMICEAEKFGIEAVRSRDGKFPSNSKIVITNYEQLHKFDPADFIGTICDEGSVVKDEKSKTKKVVNEFVRRHKYRLLCTATAAPNDFHEIGNVSEVIGMLGFRDMVTTFFKQDQKGGHKGWGRVKYRFRGHAEEPFWAWVCSFARSLRKPSDLGFSDDGYILPPLNETEHVVTTSRRRPGQLLAVAARTLEEQRWERRNSIKERVAMAAAMVPHSGPVAIWCELNDEANALVREIPGAVQVTGSMSTEEKEEILSAFTNGQIQRLVIKPKIGAWGLNWQHCCKVISFPSHSYEKYYQLVRRFYRYGQVNPVDVDLIVCEGEEGVLKSIRRKAGQADRMFSSIVAHMKNAMHLASLDFYPEKEQLPTWLS